MRSVRIRWVTLSGYGTLFRKTGSTRKNANKNDMQGLVPAPACLSGVISSQFILIMLLFGHRELLIHAVTWAAQVSHSLLPLYMLFSRTAVCLPLFSISFLCSDPAEKSLSLWNHSHPLPGTRVRCLPRLLHFTAPGGALPTVLPESSSSFSLSILQRCLYALSILLCLLLCSLPKG